MVTLSKLPQPFARTREQFRTTEKTAQAIHHKFLTLTLSSNGAHFSDISGRFPVTPSNNGKTLAIVGNRTEITREFAEKMRAIAWKISHTPFTFPTLLSQSR
jgi:hypothetical protein